MKATVPFKAERPIVSILSQYSTIYLPLCSTIFIDELIDIYELQVGFICNYFAFIHPQILY